MNDACFMSGAQGVTNLLEQEPDIVSRRIRAFGEPTLEVLSIEQLHGDPRGLGGFVDAHPHDLRHVLARDGCSDAPGLVEAPCEPWVPKEVGAHELESATLASGALLGQIDPVLAFAEGRLDREVAECGAWWVRYGGHGPSLHQAPRRGQAQRGV